MEAELLSDYEFGSSSDGRPPSGISQISYIDEIEAETAPPHKFPLVLRDKRPDPLQFGATVASWGR